MYRYCRISYAFVRVGQLPRIIPYTLCVCIASITRVTLRVTLPVTPYRLINVPSPSPSLSLGRVPPSPSRSCIACMAAGVPSVTVPSRARSLPFRSRAHNTPAVPRILPPYSLRMAPGAPPGWRRLVARPPRAPLVRARRVLSSQRARPPPVLPPLPLSRVRACRARSPVALASCRSPPPVRSPSRRSLVVPWSPSYPLYPRPARARCRLPCPPLFAARIHCRPRACPRTWLRASCCRRRCSSSAA